MKCFKSCSYVMAWNFIEKLDVLNKAESDDARKSGLKWANARKLFAKSSPHLAQIFNYHENTRCQRKSSFKVHGGVIRTVHSSFFRSGTWNHLQTMFTIPFKFVKPTNCCGFLWEIMEWRERLIFLIVIL